MTTKFRPRFGAVMAVELAPVRGHEIVGTARLFAVELNGETIALVERAAFEALFEPLFDGNPETPDQARAALPGHRGPLLEKRDPQRFDEHPQNLRQQRDHVARTGQAPTEKLKRPRSPREKKAAAPEKTGSAAAALSVASNLEDDGGPAAGTLKAQVLEALDKHKALTPVELHETVLRVRRGVTMPSIYTTTAQLKKEAEIETFLDVEGDGRRKWRRR